MWLEKIKVEGVRNLADTEISFDPSVNYLIGNNGAGKTSILEAIHFLAVGRSFRTNHDREILKFDTPYLKISGNAHNNSENYEAEIRYMDGIKTVFLQKKQQDKLSTYLGWLPVVTILLSDIDLVNGPPDRRRNFIDLTIAQISKSYLKNLIEYRKILLQRNKLLQQKADNTQYDVWESELVKNGIEVMKERRKILPLLLATAKKYYAIFMLNREIGFEYYVSLDNFESNITDEVEKFLTLLKKSRTKEQELGHTIIGPHRDDIVIREKNLAVRKFGSEGEQRLAALSLKLAEAELLSQNNRQPIFLLDEVASELDINNTRMLFELIHGQFFYATAKDFKNLVNRNGKVFYVEKGQITKTETT